MIHKRKNKLDCIKKNFCYPKDVEWKDEPQMGRKYLQNNEIPVLQWLNPVAKIQNTADTKCWLDVEQHELSLLVGMQDGRANLEDSGNFLEN